MGFSHRPRLVCLSGNTCRRKEQAYWKSPPSGWLKANVDGSSLRNPEKAGAGGLIKDEGGDWVVLFSAYVSFETAFQVELYGIKHGLSLVLDYVVGIEVEGIITESDSLTAVDMINGWKDHPNYLGRSPKIQSARHCLRRLRNFSNELRVSANSDFNIHSERQITPRIFWQRSKRSFHGNWKRSWPLIDMWRGFISIALVAIVRASHFGS
ncbi:hypothetical protein CRG98_038594 [Punica granatum]|uniref:RNase H type-1 domain-containing protein n=1 Tax=Punica granatum TaxID=22663 RepID=A0A2I0ICE9_PUNGR|nr:hypothetical protein CRG98_038594 [Punica granatum]